MKEFLYFNGLIAAIRVSLRRLTTVEVKTQDLECYLAHGAQLIQRRLSPNDNYTLALFRFWAQLLIPFLPLHCRLFSCYHYTTILLHTLSVLDGIGSTSTRCIFNCHHFWGQGSSPLFGVLSSLNYSPFLFSSLYFRLLHVFSSFPTCMSWRHEH